MEDDLDVTLDIPSQLYSQSHHQHQHHHRHSSHDDDHQSRPLLVTSPLQGQRIIELLIRNLTPEETLSCKEIEELRSIKAQLKVGQWEDWVEYARAIKRKTPSSLLHLRPRRPSSSLLPSMRRHQRPGNRLIDPSSSSIGHRHTRRPIQQQQEEEGGQRDDDDLYLNPSSTVPYPPVVARLLEHDHQKELSLRQQQQLLQALGRSFQRDDEEGDEGRKNKKKGERATTASSTHASRPAHLQGNDGIDGSESSSSSSSSSATSLSISTRQVETCRPIPRGGWRMKTEGISEMPPPRNTGQSPWGTPRSCLSPTASSSSPSRHLLVQQTHAPYTSSAARRPLSPSATHPSPRGDRGHDDDRSSRSPIGGGGSLTRYYSTVSSIQGGGGGRQDSIAAGEEEWTTPRTSRARHSSSGNRSPQGGGGSPTSSPSRHHHHHRTGDMTMTTTTPKSPFTTSMARRSSPNGATPTTGQKMKGLPLPPPINTSLRRIKPGSGGEGEGTSHSSSKSPHRGGGGGGGGKAMTPSKERIDLAKKALIEVLKGLKEGGIQGKEEMVRQVLIALERLQQQQQQQQHHRSSTPARMSSSSRPSSPMHQNNTRRAVSSSPISSPSVSPSRKPAVPTIASLGLTKKKETTPPSSPKRSSSPSPKGVSTTSYRPRPAAAASSPSVAPSPLAKLTARALITKTKTLMDQVAVVGVLANGLSAAHANLRGTVVQSLGCLQDDMVTFTSVLYRCCLKHMELANQAAEKQKQKFWPRHHQVLMMTNPQSMSSYYHQDDDDDEKGGQHDVLSICRVIKSKKKMKMMMRAKASLSSSSSSSAQPSVVGVGKEEDDDRPYVEVVRTRDTPTQRYDFDVVIGGKGGQQQQQQQQQPDDEKEIEEEEKKEEGHEEDDVQESEMIVFDQISDALSSTVSEGGVLTIISTGSKAAGRSSLLEGVGGGKGLICRAVNHLLKTFDHPPNKQIEISVSAIEVAKNQVRDLLGRPKAFSSTNTFYILRPDPLDRQHHCYITNALCVRLEALGDMERVCGVVTARRCRHHHHVEEEKLVGPQGQGIQKQKKKEILSLPPSSSSSSSASNNTPAIDDTGGGTAAATPAAVEKKEEGGEGEKENRRQNQQKEQPSAAPSSTGAMHAVYLLDIKLILHRSSSRPPTMDESAGGGQEGEGEGRRRMRSVFWSKKGQMGGEGEEEEGEKKRTRSSRLYFFDLCPERGIKNNRIINKQGMIRMENPRLQALLAEALASKSSICMITNVTDDLSSIDETRAMLKSITKSRKVADEKSSMAGGGAGGASSLPAQSFHHSCLDGSSSQQQTKLGSTSKFIRTSNRRASSEIPTQRGRGGGSSRPRRMTS